MTRFGWFSAAFGIALLTVTLASLHPAITPHASFTALFWIFAPWYSLTMFVGLRSLKNPAVAAPRESHDTSNKETPLSFARYPHIARILVQALWPLQLTIYSILAVVYAAIWYAAATGGETAVHLLKPQPWIIIVCVASLIPAMLLLVFGLCVCKAVATLLASSQDRAA